ncbi:sulfite exporter TauE/SafE family protein [Maribellus maritimus]|uniref:sulfite exporter TauE/SafE family protein n=1 Tax=Maribellus maritimus TaxID=2870838 RepID=UPI001EEC5F6B|nr:sulfite exporter TauE/SafE family protein [Maribellus maritimus]MCG6187927.1 sulfite exporter TauE/SafE family protein [Maribellus maritimus]
MNELYLLYVTAASLGFFHTLLGPDHYVPFIVLSKARNWSRSKTLWVTFVSGLGHVSSSVVLGFIGIALGISVSKLESIEAFRGEIVGWLLFAFGLIYFFYGLFRHIKRRGHHHHFFSFLLPGRIRKMHHLNDSGADMDKNEKSNVTFWMLFLIFVFGPCEVLIPMLIFPAAEHSSVGVATVAIIFGLATIVTMLSIVYLGYKGARFLNFKDKGEYVHIAAGLVIAFLGTSILFLGW